ncbi:hypothetical protein ACHQM5_004715 [Ranunculus cassubicifolius]
MSSFLLVFLFLVFNGLIFSTLATIDDEDSIRFELIHRHDSRQLSEATTHHEKIKELVHLDNHRVELIAKSIGKRKKKPKRAFSIIQGVTSGASIPLNSGAYTRTGQYFVSLQIGTPPQEFLLITDTGSDLLWTNCHYKCPVCEKKKMVNKHQRFFHADQSSSFDPIPCTCPYCQGLPFAYQYLDGTKAHGIFANETVTVTLASGKKAQLGNVVIGCTAKIEGPHHITADGVIGLGYSRSSFILQSKAMFGGVFSYCLVDHLSPRNVSSYLTLGHTNLRNLRSENMRVTELVLDGKGEGYYMVNVDGISIGGDMLDIPQYVWKVKGEGGMVVDSGTSFTILAEPAYVAVMSALKPYLENMTQVAQPEPTFEFCFNSTGYHDSMVPKLRFHFEDGARFEPYVKSFVIDNAPEEKCIGLISTSWPGVSTLGNIMQQNYVWEFDTMNKNLGFAPSTCVG